MSEEELKDQQSTIDKILDLSIKSHSNSIIALALSVLSLGIIIGCLLR